MARDDKERKWKRLQARFMELHRQEMQAYKDRKLDLGEKLLLKKLDLLQKIHALEEKIPWSPDPDDDRG